LCRYLQASFLDKESDLRFLSLGNIGNSKYRYKFEGISSISYQLTEQQQKASFTKLMVDFRPLDVLEGNRRKYFISSKETQFQNHIYAKNSEHDF